MRRLPPLLSRCRTVSRSPLTADNATAPARKFRLAAQRARPASHTSAGAIGPSMPGSSRRVVPCWSRVRAMRVRSLRRRPRRSLRADVCGARSRNIAAGPRVRRIPRRRTLPRCSRSPCDRLGDLDPVGVDDADGEGALLAPATTVPAITTKLPTTPATHRSARRPARHVPSERLRRGTRKGLDRHGDHHLVGAAHRR